MSTGKTKPKSVKRSAEREIMIQCRLSQKLHDRVQQLAEIEGDSMASYVRRVLRAESTRGYALAAVVPREQLLVAGVYKPTCALRLLRQIDARHAAYALLDKDTLDGSAYEPLIKAWWANQSEYLVLLQGMRGYYEIVGTVLLHSSGSLAEMKPLYLEMTLRAESFNAGEGMFVG